MTVLMACSPRDGWEVWSTSLVLRTPFRFVPCPELVRFEPAEYCFPLIDEILLG
jgi:hypothetical protein